MPSVQVPQGPSFVDAVTLGSNKTLAFGSVLPSYTWTGPFTLFGSSDASSFVPLVQIQGPSASFLSFDCALRYFYWLPNQFSVISSSFPVSLSADSALTAGPQGSQGLQGPPASTKSFCFVGGLVGATQAAATALVIGESTNNPVSGSFLPICPRFPAGATLDLFRLGGEGIASSCTVTVYAGTPGSWAPIATLTLGTNGSADQDGPISIPAGSSLCVQWIAGSLSSGSIFFLLEGTE